MSDKNAPTDEQQKMNLLCEDMAQLGTQIQAFMLSAAKPQDSSASSAYLLGIGKAFMAASQEFLKHPEKVNEASNQLIKDSFALWQTTIDQMHGTEPSSEAPHMHFDKRFKDPLWESNATSAFVMHSYLLYARWVETVADDLEGLDENSRRKIKFYSRQFVDAVSPSNFAWVNPTVLKKTIETRGDNLLKGMTRFLEDLKNGTSLLNIQNTDRTAFEIGKDLAATSGKVIFQNDLIQLIQYEPLTKKVHKAPLLVVPPWINKYYILDLRPENSFAKWLVEQGHTVFMISWANPGPALKETVFDDYLTKGSLAAIEAMQKITGEKKVNLVGFCLGGISLSALVGSLQDKAKETIASLTLMSAPLDFTQAGELTLFTDKEFMGQVSGKMSDTGLLDGKAMGATFNMLRANDLIWSAFINNYLLANEQPQFDMLYWNADTTNLPEKMLTYYIDDMCQNNALMKAGQTKVLGHAVDMSKADIPIFLFGAHDDHIAPWKSLYAAIPKLHGPVKFVLGGSGHIAGMINHPVNNKYGHWEHNDYTLSPQEWLDTAEYSEDSWWLVWREWAKQYAGDLMDAKQRIPGKGPYKILEDAPGSYVKVTSEEAMKE